MSLILNSDNNEKGNIFLGDINDINNICFLKEKNISAIVCATGENEIDFKKLGISSFLVVKAFDYYEFDISQFFSHATKYIEEQRPNGNILIYCYSGKSRSSTLLIAYMIKALEIPFEKAIAMVKEKRPIVKPNKGFEKQLKDLEKQLLK